MNKQPRTPISAPRGMKQLYALGEKRPIDLSLSENPLGCSPLVSAAFRGLRIQEVSEYPSANGQQLKAGLAEKFSLAPQNFFIANGSETIISVLPRVFGEQKGKVLVPALSFPMFRICSELAGKTVQSVEMDENLALNLEAFAKAVTPATEMIFLCNPNNPTGSVIPRERILQFLSKVPSSVIVVVDEANIEFGGESVLQDVRNWPNLIVLRTFSKAFGLAALRVGFAVSNPEFIQKLEEEIPLFPISQVSEELACVALQDDAFLEETKRFVAVQRQFLVTGLSDLGCKVFPSEANNLFVQIPEKFDSTLFTQRLQEQGVSVVLGSCFAGWDNSAFRISVRDLDTNQQFLEKMRVVLRE